MNRVAFSGWPAAQGEMASLIRAFDWRATALGAMEGWPQGLKATLDIILDSPLPSYVWWGADLVQFYNDPAIVLNRDRHPAIFGMPARKAWSDVWHVVGEVAEKVRGGTPVLAEDLPLFPGNRRAPEESWFTFSCSPLRDASGAVAGMLVLVTKHAAAEAALRQREAELARVQRIGGVGGVDVDLAHGLRGHRSPEYARLHGLPEDRREETHEDWLRRVHPDDRERAARTLQEAVEGSGSLYESEYRIVRPSDGEVRWISAIGDIERDETGRAFRLIGAHIDVTDRRRTEAALRESEERLRVALEAGRMGTWRYDLRTGEQQWSAAQFQIFGLPPDVPPTRELFLSLVHPDDLHRVEFSSADIRPEGTFLDTEFRIIRPDGERRWVVAHALARFDGEGRPTEIIGVNQDVTERKRAEEALRNSEERLREFSEASSDLLWIRDAATLQWEYLSPAFERIYGLSRQDALRGDNLQSWKALILPEDRPLALSNLEKVRAGKRVTFECRIRRPVDGELRWLRNTDFPMRDEEGRVHRIGGISHDITPAKKAEDYQRLLLGELQHRVRNTLGVIRSIVRRTADTSRSVEDYAMHLDGRINAFARVQAALTRNPAAGLDLENLVVEELLAYEAREGEQVFVKGPPIRLTAKAAETFGLIIHELATNAVKHGALATPEGRIRAMWQVKGDGEGQRFSFEWKESGVRIEDAAPRGRGFGTELLEKTLGYELRGHARQVLEPDGLRCTIELPLTDSIVKGA